MMMMQKVDERGEVMAGQELIRVIYYRAEELAMRIATCLRHA